jgi:uncharacterized protein (DUF1697 family)
METIKYIAFLRGINIGGHNIKMERLRELFSQLGFADVRSYIQTGNIFFETTETDRAALARKIELHLFAALGYEVPTFLRTVREVEQILQLEPFKDIEVTPEMRLFIIFTSESLPNNLALPLSPAKGDFEIIATTPAEAFAVMRLINDTPGNPAALIEKNFKVKTTSRFFGTTLKILQAAKGN